jgi:SNF2 family DNA or RNA helicase
MELPAAKRFRATPVVDLTLSDDSDSDDDIVITSVRRAPTKPSAATKTFSSSARPSYQTQLPLTPASSSPAFQNLLDVGAASSSSGTALPPRDQFGIQVRTPKQLQPVRQVTVNGDARSVKAASNHMDGLKVHANGAIEYHGHFYTSMQDIRNREDELKGRINKYQRGIDALAFREKAKPQKQMEVKRKRDQLLRLGMSEDNPKIMELQNEMKRLSVSTTEMHKRKREFQEGLEKCKKKAQLFINAAKPTLMTLVQEKLERERHGREEQVRFKQETLNASSRNELLTPAERQRLDNVRLGFAPGLLQGGIQTAPLSRSQVQQLQREVLQRQNAAQMQQQRLLRQSQHQNNGGLINMANNAIVNPFREAVNNVKNGLMDDYNRMIEEQVRRQREREQLLHNPMALNAYNTDDLVHLLESVKKQEEREVEGESNTPDELTVNLLKHQRRGLKWLEDTEDDDKKRGGILADAMGLGKTVQMISLIISHRAEEPKDHEEEELNPESPEYKKAPYGKTNLIIAPVSLINQWEGELQSKVKDSAGLKIFMYHSLGGRKITYEQLKKYDIVLTSYGTLASELRKHCSFPGFEESFNLKTPINIRALNQMKGSEGYQSPFFTPESKFYRMILDESQQIKNKAAKASVAVATVEAYYRWCLSGTPMQNNVNELYPLLRFLRIKPYNIEARFKSDITNPLEQKGGIHEDGFYKESAMNKLRILLRSVMIRREKNSIIDGKPILDLPEKTVIREDIELSINKNEETFYRSVEGSSQMKVKKLLNNPATARGNYSYIFTMLLRLRQACLHSELVRIGDRRAGISYDEDGNVIATANVDSMCHNAEKLQPDVIRRINARSEEETGFDCPICLETNLEGDAYTLFFPCGHGICKECIESFFEEFQENASGSSRVAKCTSCRMNVKENEVIDYTVFDKKVNKGQGTEMIKIAYESKRKEDKKVANEMKVDELEYSPKIKGCIELLQRIWEENPNDKVIIFSHFTSFFFILKKFLKERDIEPLQYVGSMNPTSRNEVVKEFYRNDDCKLMLISLKAGNSGLTLTCANHVIIMDPFWNPYVEAQAQDRCHRIGQQKPVKVYRMLIKDTVEDRILDLQDRKQRLIESAIDPTGMKEASRLSREDIANLFGVRL